MQPVKKTEALVLCIDRDDDLGKKAGIRGPIIGEENNFTAARALAMADPEDTDVNAIFAAIKTKRECEHLYHGVEVITITGDKEVGVKSDQKIGNQLVRILEVYQPKGIILVTDGAEDEEVMPILQSETKILSVKTITVKQAKALESAYFKIQDFFGRISDNPRQAKMMFGVPGLIIFMTVLLSYLGLPIVELILALVGIYLIAKGFGYDEQLFSGLTEVKNSLIQGGNIYKLFNGIAILIFVLALVTGYLQLQKNLDAIYRPSSIANPVDVSDALVSQPIMAMNLLLFSSGGVDFAAIDLFIIATSIVAIGFMIHNFVIKNYLRIKRYIYLLLFVWVVKYMSGSIYWAIIAWQPDATTLEITSFDPIQNLLINLIIALVVILVVHYIMKIVFFDYIAKRKKIEGMYLGREMVGNNGKKLGKVTGVIMRSNEMKGLQIKRKYFDGDKIHTKGKILIVDE